MRRISVSLSWSSHDDVDQFVEQAKVADDSGVAVLFTGENWRREAFTPMAVLARETKHAQLGTAIVNIWSRSAAALAEHFATIDELAGGRVIIGLGASSANVAEGFAGVPYKRPLRRMREYIEIMNMLISGAPLQYHGELFQLERGFRLEINNPRPHIPVYIAATSPASVRQTAEIADGWMPIQIPRSQWKAATGEFYEHARQAGRDPSELTIKTANSIYVTDDPGPELEKTRGTVAFYIARMGDGYYNQFAQRGFRDMADAVRAAWAEGGSKAGAEAVPPEFAEQMFFAGPPEACAEHLDELEEAGFNLHSVQIAERDPAKRASIYRTLVG
ncbi:MAG: LLM class flavin-dependent oxidoreductase [Dehalococcoidia bacterium]